MKTTLHMLVLLGTTIVAATGARGEVDVTGQWSLTGTDTAGTTWMAILDIGQGFEQDGVYPLTGSILWKATGGPIDGTVSAYEDFRDGVFGTQSYFDPATMLIHIEGTRIRDVSAGDWIGVADNRGDGQC